MMWRDVVQLVRLDYIVNDYGDQEYLRTTQTVFANKKSVRQSEFYQALATGLKPEIMFEVRSLEYTGQENLIYNLKEYVIIRTYSKNDEITELVCSGLVVKGEGF
jgi:SPP1 family predicted phage head-tail adaptor